jgi:hypothetical protein
MLKKLFAYANRGILLDVVVFVVNVVLMMVLSRQLANLFLQAKAEPLAQAATAVFCFSLVFLQPISAILKRRRAHRRKPDLNHVPFGRLILPAYFLSQLVFLIGASGQIVDFAYGKNPAASSAVSSAATPAVNSADYFGLPPGMFALLFFGIPALAIANSFILWFYFQPPKRKPVSPWLESPQAETLGDVAIFLNMIGYQAFWGLLMTDLPHDYPTVAGRLSMFAFAALLIYIPPRIFYLAEDGRRPVVWLTMLLANSPVLLRILFATSSKSV